MAPLLAVLTMFGERGLLLAVGVMWLLATSLTVRSIREFARRQGRAPSVAMMFERDFRRSVWVRRR
jgi:hypothetical protein